MVKQLANRKIKITLSQIFFITSFVLIISNKNSNSSVLAKSALTDSLQKCDTGRSYWGEDHYRGCITEQFQDANSTPVYKEEYDKVISNYLEFNDYLNASLDASPDQDARDFLESRIRSNLKSVVFWYSKAGNSEKTFEYIDLLIDTAESQNEINTWSHEGKLKAVKFQDCTQYDRYDAIYAQDKPDYEGEDYRREDACGKPVEEEIEEEKETITGKIIDWLGDPLPYLTIIIDSGEERDSLITDKNGNFSTKLKGDVNEKWKIRIEFLAMAKDGSWIFSFIDRRSSSSNPIWIELPFDPQKMPLNIEFDFSKENLKKLGLTTYDLNSNLPELIKAKSSFAMSANLGLNYTAFTDAYTFAQEKLKVSQETLLSNGQLKVLLFEPEDKDEEYGTYFLSINNLPTINIDPQHFNLFKSQAFLDKYVFYHEFGHFLMYSVYGETPYDEKSTQHAGYVNPTTTDSFSEGFANFYALLVKDYVKEEEPFIFGPFGSMEVNHQAWDENGTAEEFAVASVLWDLYDVKDPKENDNVQMSLDAIWKVLSQAQSNFADVYDKLPFTKEEKAKNGIDTIFINHGFYKDETEGDGEYDQGEPYKDKNNNGTYDNGDELIDLAGEDGIPTYDENEQIGPATNYHRKKRKTIKLRERMQVDVPIDALADVVYYLVKVQFGAPYEHQSYDLKASEDNGKVYVQLPPRNYKGTITVEAEDRAATNTKFSIVEGYKQWYSGANVLGTVEEKIDFIAILIGVFVGGVFVAAVVGIFWFIRKKRQPLTPTKEQEDDQSIDQPTQQSDLKLKKIFTRKKKIILGILFISSLSVISFLLYQNSKLSDQPTGQPRVPTSSSTPTPLSSPSSAVSVRPTPTPDPTASWKTYSNPVLGLSLKYPASYQASESADYFSIMSPLLPNRGEGYEVRDGELKIEIYITAAEPNQTLSQYVDQKKAEVFSTSKITNEDQIKLDGKEAFYCAWEDEIGDGETTMVLHQGYLFEIIKYPLTTTRQSEYTQIRSTLKFTKPVAGE